MAKIVCNFYSRTLLRAVDITVIIPTSTCPESLGLGDKPTHVITDKYPVVYLLHGFGNNHAQWTGYTNVEMYAEEQRIAIVNLSAENKSYSKVGGDDFFTFVSEELPEFVTNMFPISARPEDTYIAGLSMGGYGSYLHGLTHPERFTAIGTFSAGVEIVPEQLANMGGGNGFAGAAGGKSVLHDLAKAVKEEGKTFPKIYAACGTADFLFASCKAFADELKELGADVTWDEIEGYGHEWRFWNIEVEKFLEWLPRTDAYAAKGKRAI